MSDPLAFLMELQRLNLGNLVKYYDAWIRAMRGLQAVCNLSGHQLWGLLILGMDAELRTIIVGSEVYNEGAEHALIKTLVQMRDRRFRVEILILLSLAAREA